MARHAHDSIFRDISLPFVLDLELENFTSEKGGTDFSQPADKADNMDELQVPTHPMPCMQGPFAESMIEASTKTGPPSPKFDKKDAVTRRQILLDQDASEATHASKLRQKPGQKYHELWKLIAQISFGSYLLFDGIARDEDQVLNILQGHVDEVDSFLETTLEDFDHAQDDIDERLKCLKIPLENIEVFDAMLQDRQFRYQIVKGNERIEHVITRTASAMNDALRDVQQGLSATKEFTIWLAACQEDPAWIEKSEMEKVYDAMKGNADGWYKAFVSLQTKGNHLGIALVQLGSIVAEMDRRTGDVSRRLRFSAKPGSPPTSPKRSHASIPIVQQPHQSPAPRASLASSMKEDPTTTPAIQGTLPAFQLVSERELSPEPEEKPREQALESLGAFTLQPRTYSPAPRTRSPRPPQVQAKPPTPEPEVEPPAPELSRRSSLRERFSLRRKNNPPSIITPTIITPTTITPPINNSHSSHSVRASSTQPQSFGTVSYERPASSMTRSQGFAADSAYYSDSDPPPISRTPIPPQDSYFTPPNPGFSSSSNYISSPRSDQQHFRPVRASPHSPLQRPWTAAPSHMHSNLRSASTTNLSVAESQMTTVTENGKKVKKKRSGFGWLKKAFSLSEEEKLAFEERRRAQMPQEDYYRQERPIFLDGRRIR